MKFQHKLAEIYSPRVTLAAGTTDSGIYNLWIPRNVVCQLMLTLYRTYNIHIAYTFVYINICTSTSFTFFTYLHVYILFNSMLLMFIIIGCKYVGVRCVICVYLFQSSILSYLHVNLILKHIMILIWLYVYTVLNYITLMYLIAAYYDTLWYLQWLTYCNSSLNVEVRLN